MVRSYDFTKIEFTDFDWDEGNRQKNWLKHKVRLEECEEIFYNEPIRIYKDLHHSELEVRLVAYGRTDMGRKLTVVFTLRKTKIRIISARDQSRKERRFYESKKNSEI